MISFAVDDHRFNLRAAAIFLHEGAVLLHRLAGDTVWALPGGRVESGEDAAAAIVREMKEEVGELVQCGELLYVVENFYEYRSTLHHEVGLYFHAELPPATPLRIKNRAHFGIEGGQRLEFRWFLQSALPALNLHPAFLREALSRPVLTFRHVVQRS